MGSYMPTVPSPSSPSSPSTLPPPPPPARHDQDPAFTHGWARRNSYRTFKTIGAGSEGRVKAAVHLASGRGVALKIHTKPVEPVLSRGLKASTSFEKAVRDCRNYVPELRRKFEAVRGLDHPGVLRQIEMFEVQDKVYIASELCAGDLQSYLDAHGPLTEPQIRTVLRSLLSTLGYCHSLGITHRDIKPSNVLLRRPDDLSDICLSDFSTSSILPLSSGQLMKTVVGTPFYLPPEIVRGQPYSPKVDVYSLGCMAFQLAYGHTPFEGSRSFMDLYARIAGDDWTFPENSGGSTDFKQFVSQLLHPDPLTRPSADDALRHPFLSRRDSNPSRYGLEKRLSGVHVVFQDGELRFAVPEAVGVWASGAVLAI